LKNIKYKMKNESVKEIEKVLTKIEEHVKKYPDDYWDLLYISRKQTILLIDFLKNKKC